MSKTLARNRDNQNSIYGLVDKHASWLEQSLLETSTPTFGGLNITNDVVIGGDLTVSGMTTIINTDILEIKDNIIEINSSEVGPGVTTPQGLSGIQVNRGGLVAYQSVFRELDDSFCVGQVGDLQVVATRENLPLHQGIMLFNNSLKRLDAVTTLPLSLTFTSAELATSSTSGTLRVQGGVGITGDQYIDSRIYLKGSNYTNYIYTDINQQLTLNSTSGISLDVSTNVKIPANKPLIFGTTNHYISSNGTNLTMESSGSITIQPGSGLAVNLRTNSPLTFGNTTEKITYNGTNMVIDASNLLQVNTTSSFTNTSSSTSPTTGGLRTLGGIGISNTADSASSTNGGSLTTSGGIGIAKKLFVGGVSTFENVDESVSLSVFGGATVNKKLIIGSNYSGNPLSSDAVYLQSSGYTFTDNTTSTNGTVSSVNFNFLGINSLNASNTLVNTTNSSTLFVEGAPVSGTNQTITNRYSIYVDEGTSRFNGDLQIKSTTYNTSLLVEGGVTINKNLNVNSKFDVGANISSAPSSSGVFLSFSQRTVTDNVTLSGTVSEMLFNVISQPTLASTNVITTTDSSTFVINGPPIQSTNQTLTNVYSLWIKSGALRLDGNFINSGTVSFSNTTDATSSLNGGSLTVSGGSGIAKKLFVGGIATFENVLESSDTITAGTVVSGGLSVNKNTKIGKGLHTGVDNFSEASGLGKIFKSGGAEFTDNVTSASGTQSIFSTNEFSQSTLKASNTLVTTTNASTLYIAGPVIAGTNQTITNNHSLYINSGNSRFGGNLKITGSVDLDTNLTMQGNLDVNGATLLDQVTIVTDDGQFSVSGSNPVNINVSNNCTVTNTSGNITIDSQAGSLTLDGNNSMTLDSTGGISIDAGTTSNLNVAVGTLTIGAPTLVINSTTTTIDATSTVNGIKIGTLTSGVPITIGHTISETTIADNLTVTGNFTVLGDTTTINSNLITTEDNAVVVNSMPASMSDGGLLIRRYQLPNNTSLGQVVQDTPRETGAFQSSLTLALTASTVVDFYKGWWIKITSGAGNNYVRRIKSSSALRAITIYVTADNNSNFADGMDLGITITGGDTYQLFPGTYAGMFYDDSANEVCVGRVPFEENAGVFPLHGYLPFHVGILVVDETLDLVSGMTVQGQILVDYTSSRTILIRKNGNTGDVFYVDTTNSSINLANPVNTTNSASNVKFLGYDSVNGEVLYSQITSRIKDNTTTLVDGELSLGVVRNSVLENYIVLDALAQTCSVNSVTNITDSTSSTSSNGALKVTGGITSLATTDATSITSGGGLTILGGAGISKKLFVGTDASFNSNATGTGTIRMGPSSNGGESSISFYGNTAYSGQVWSVGHAVTGSATNAFGIYNSNTSSLSLTISTAGVLSIPSTAVSSTPSNGALTVSGGVGVLLDLNVGGNITGTWNGATISVAKGGTGATTLTSTGVLIGNGTGAVSAGSGISYTANTLTLPKIISNDTTDSTSSISGSIQIAGGVGIAKKLFIGTDLDINGNVYLSGTDTVISHTTTDASDNGSISIASGGAYGATRGASILLKGNEHASEAGKIVLTCGNVNSTGDFSIVTANTERLNIGYTGIVNITNSLEASSSIVGSVTMAGGLAIAKKLFVGGDLNVTGNFSLTTVTSGTWNANTITVAYGGTGATSLSSTCILLGNGTSPISTDAGFTFSTNTLTTPKITSTDTTQSTSSSTGAITLLGGLGVAKNVYMGESLYVSERIGLGTSTNVNSALTLASGSNIGINTVVTSDTGSLSISGSGVGLASRGSIINLYGIDHSTLAGNLLISAGTTSGSFTLNTGNTARISVTTAGITTFTKVADSVSSTSGAVVVTGGLSISNTTNSTSTANGGSFTTAGGASIAQDLYVGGNLIMTGAIPGATTFGTPSITTSSLVNISTSVASSVKIQKVGFERTLRCAFQVTPSAVRSTCTFEFTLPEVVTNLVDSYDIVASANGYLADFTPVENLTTYGVSGSVRGKVRFTSGPTTGNHIIQVVIYYTLI
jgi:hypothetical protein